MKPPHDQPGPRFDADPALAPESDARDPREVAREQFIHGLLGFIHHDDPARQVSRVAGAMAAIDASVAGHEARAAQARRARMTIRSRPVWRVASGLAAAAAIALAVFFSIPTAPAVATLIDSSLAASLQGVDRRYEVRVSAPNAERAEGDPIATIDTRGTDRMVVRATTPRGDRVAFGRDAKGDWNLVPGGALERVGAASRRPSWIDFGESTIMMESMDLALERLKEEYDAKVVDSAPASPGGKPLDRLSATLKVRNGSSPERLELWIDRSTRLVERLEMHWAPRPRPFGPDGRSKGRTERDAAHHHPDDHDHPGDHDHHHDRSAGPREGRGGPEGMPPGPRDGGGGGARPGDGADLRGPRGPRPGPDGAAPREGDAGRPPLPHPPRDRRPNADGPPSRPDGPPPGRPGGPGGPGNPPPPEGPGMGPDGPGPRGGPRPMHGPPDFARQPPPPRVMVITRAEVQPVTDDWFSPEAHTEWVAQGVAKGRK